MILLKYNLRLAAAYVFEKRNRSRIPVMMVSLILLLPRSRFSKYASLSRCGRSYEFTHASAAHRIPVRTCRLCVISHNLGMPPENDYYNEVMLNDPTLTLNNPVAGHEIQILLGTRQRSQRVP
jgi:hypothetical protein